MSEEWDRGSMIFGAVVAIAGAAVIAATVFLTQDSTKDPHAGLNMAEASPEATARIATRPEEPAWLTERRIAAERALEINPDDLDALNILTQVYLPQPASALVYNQRALEAAPDDPDARTLEAVLMSMVGDRDEALAQIDAVLAEHPEHIRALTFKGLVSLEAGRYDDAELALRSVISLAGEDPGVRAALDEVRRRRNENPEPDGEVVLSGTIDLDPSKKDAFGAVVFVSLRDPAGGLPLAAVRLPPGPFPMDFQVRSTDVVAMGGGAAVPVPPTFHVSVRFDQDGSATTRVAGEPEATIPFTSRGTTDLAVTLK